MPVEQHTLQHFGNALYYPYIKIKDLNWLKSAILYWDGIRLIMPQTANDYNNEEPYQELFERGYLIESSPMDYIRETENIFRERFLPIIRDQKILKNWLYDTLPLFKDLHTEGIHVEKMSNSLFNELRDRNLVRSEGNWIRMPDNIGGIYLICLGAVMSTRMRTPLITDSLEFSTFCESILLGSPISGPNPEKLTRVIQGLSLKFPAPSQLENVPFRKIIEFCHNHADEKRRFREFIESIINDIRKLNDPNSISDYLSEKKSEIKREMRRRKRSLDNLNISSLNAALKISCPLLISTSIASLQQLIPVYNELLWGSGVLLSASAWWTNRRERKEKIVNTNPLQYLIELKKIVGASNTENHSPLLSSIHTLHECNRFVQNIKNSAEYFIRTHSKDGYLNEEKASINAQKIIHQADELKDVFLILHKLLLGTVNEKISISLSELFEKTIAKYLQDRKVKNLRIIKSYSEDDIVEVYKSFEILVFMLFDNAVKYSFRDAPIKITVVEKRDKNSFAFSIESYGNIIPEHHRDSIFKPQYRVDNRRVEEGGGMGLFIAQEIAKAHGFLIGYESYRESSWDRREGWNRFYFTLPKRELSAR